MNQNFRIGGGNLNTSKKLYQTPELRVINIDSCDLICTSPGASFQSERGIYDDEEDI